MKFKQLMMKVVLATTLLQGINLVQPSLLCPSVQAYESLPFGLSTVVIDGDIYIRIHVRITDNMIVDVNGDTTKPIRLYDEEAYYYRVTESGEYRVTVTNDRGESGCQYIDVQLDSQPPKLVLRRKYYNEAWHLQVEVSDDYKLKEVQMGDEYLTIPEEGGIEDFKVDETKTYEVVATDAMGHKTTASIYIDVSRKTMKPELKLSKEYQDDSWYLIVEAKDHYGIKQVTLNDEPIAFDSKEDRVYHKIEQTDSYRVKVINEDDEVAEDSLYIDKYEKVSIPPTLQIQQEDRPDGSYIVIHIDDNEEIVSVDVEGQVIPFNKETKTAEYKLEKTGIYQIHVKDDEDNEVGEPFTVKQLVNVIKSHEVIYHANSKKWSKDGEEQAKLEVAPQMVSGSIYLPLRAVADALGIPADKVTWDSQQKVVVIMDGSTTVTIPLGEKQMQVNGQNVPMKAATQTIQGKMMLPLSSITQAFAEKQVQLQWDNTHKKLTVTYKG